MNKEVYTQSVCLINIVTDLYYFKGCSQAEISEILDISKATVSRLLKLAVKNNIIHYEMDENAKKALYMQDIIKKKYKIQEVYVVPISQEDVTDIEIKKMVAREGSRYVQRIMKDNQMLGMTWGGTMHYMIQYLNPCQKKNTSIITMHGDISECGEEYDVNNLVKRAAMAFGGRRYIMGVLGYMEKTDRVRNFTRQPKYQQFIKMFENITISVAGVGSWYPEIGSPLSPFVTNYVTRKDLEELKQKDVAADFLLHFLDKNGKEIDSDIKRRTISIDLEIYKKIPLKIVMASGKNKSSSVNSVLEGRYADVLIIDSLLAESLLCIDE